MTDEIIQNDCQGEQMYSAEIPINIELGSAGLYYGTSPQMKGLLVTGHTIREVMDRVPAAIAEMRAVAAMGPEIARLNAELTEAREIIGGLDELLTVICHAMKDFAEKEGVDASLIEPFARAPAEGSLFARARAFLKEKADG